MSDGSLPIGPDNYPTSPSQCSGPPSFTDMSTGISVFDSNNTCFGWFVGPLGGQNNTNATIFGLIPNSACDLSLCPLIWKQAHFNYVPSLAGNAVLAAIFGIILLSQLGLGVRYRTWGFLFGMTAGLVLEVVGYIGRIMMHNNPFLKNPFLIYLICLTIGPAFLSGAIYVCLARVVVAFGQHISRFSPRFYTITFVSCDVFSLVLQAIGGALASTANTQSSEDRGVNVMIAGLAFQVASLFFFMLLCSDFAWRVFKAPEHSRNRAFDLIRASTIFRGFLYALGGATIFIFIRSVYRVAELKGGFHGTLANQEATYMILEGLMIVLATTLLTIFHPGPALGGQWGAANFNVAGPSGRGEKSITPPGSSFEVDKGSQRVQATAV